MDVSERETRTSQGSAAHDLGTGALAGTPVSNGRRERSGRLVGRHSEMTRIDRLLGEAEPGYPTVLQIAGASGIGKTRLLSALLGRAQQAGYLALTGRAAEFDADQPYGVFIDLLDRSVPELAQQRLLTLGDESLRELAGVFPALSKRIAQGAAEPPPSASSAGVERYRLHRAVSALCDLLAAGRPLLLAVDDLHWADPASVELLLYLLRRPPSAPLVVAVTFRPRQLHAKTTTLLAQIERDSRGALLELPPLTAAEAHMLLPADLPAPVAERIYRDSAGNPFFLKELIRAAQRGLKTAPVASSENADRLPTTITAVIASELEALSPGSRELIQAASVVGDPFEPEVAGEIVEMDDGAALAALDELVDRDLVQVDLTHGSFSFRHPVVRQAVYEGTKGGWRRGAHARAAAMLSARGASAAARARHIERSARLGDAEAIAVLTEAGRSAAARAPAAAAGWFRAALRLLPDQAERDRRLELMLAMAVSLGSAGNLEESRDAFHELFSLLPPDPSLRGNAAGTAALIEHLLGKHDEAQGLLLSTLSGLDDRSLPATEVRLSIADGCFFSADWNGMRYWAQKAGEDDDAPAILRAGADAALALAHYGLGDVQTAQGLASKAAAAVESLGDSDWAARLQAVCYLGWAEYCVGRFEQAERRMKRALAVSRTTGQEHLSGAMLVVQAMSNLALGRLELASEQAETAIDTSMLSTNHLFLTWALTMRCMVEIDRGSPAAAVEFGRKAVQAGIDSRSAWSSVATLYLAEARLEAGEPKAFRKELFAGDSAPRLPPFPFYAVHAFELLTRAELDLGLADAAARWAQQAADVASQLGLGGPCAEAQRAQAALLLSGGSFANAAELAQTSADQAEAARQPIQAARSRLLAGLALQQAGESRAAIEQLRAAEEAFAGHGAWRYRDQAARALRQLGIHVASERRRARTQAPSPARLSALSKREMTVAALVHGGRTNRQIAQELSISLKTVENHLGKAFRRLEISSRSQLAMLVERSLNTDA
jgi:DNA-binding NarL/FixJ family response regulator